MIGSKLGIYSQGGVGFDPDAQAYITAASIVDATEIAAVNQIFDDLKGKGNTTNNSNIFSKFYALYLVSPTSLAATEINAANPGTYNITWYNSPTHTSLGIKGNGSNQYGDTGFQPALIANINDFGLSVDVGLTGGGLDMGSNSYAHINSSSSSYTYILGGLGSSVNGTANTIGLRTVVRRSSNDLEAYVNGVTEGTDTTLSGSLNNLPLFLMCRNQNGNASFLSTKRYRFFAIHRGMTTQEAVDLNDAVSKYNTTLGR